MLIACKHLDKIKEDKIKRRKLDLMREAIYLSLFINISFDEAKMEFFKGAIIYDFSLFKS